MIVIRIVCGILLLIALKALYDCFVIGYERYGWCKKFFHDMLHNHAPYFIPGIEYKDGDVAYCKYCRKRITYKHNKWREH